MNCGKYKTDGYNSKYEKKTKIYVKEKELNKIILKDEDFVNGTSLISKITKKLNKNYSVTLELDNETKNANNEVYGDYKVKINDKEVDYNIFYMYRKNTAYDSQIDLYSYGNTLVIAKETIVNNHNRVEKVAFFNSKLEKNYEYEQDKQSDKTSEIEFGEDKVTITINDLFYNTNNVVFTSLGHASSCENQMSNGTRVCYPFFSKEELDINSYVKVTLDDLYTVFNIDKTYTIKTNYTYKLVDNELSTTGDKTIENIEDIYNEMIKEGYKLYLSKNVS